MLATETLYTPYNGAVLLENPLLNKGLAFTESERTAFNLQGLLPHNVETIEEQTERAWGQFCQFKKSISRHIYLRNIQDTNETLFYNLLRSHMKETLPVIYTPTVGEACEHFSEIYRRGRGLFISWPNRHQIDEMLQGFSRNDIKVIGIHAAYHARCRHQQPAASGGSAVYGLAPSAHQRRAVPGVYGHVCPCHSATLAECITSV